MQGPTGVTSWGIAAGKADQLDIRALRRSLWQKCAEWGSHFLHAQMPPALLPALLPCIELLIW
jgi:hypothetical protein